MNIESISTATSQATLRSNVNIAVLSKSLDTIEKAGQDLIQLLEQSVQPYLGKNIDLKI